MLNKLIALGLVLGLIVGLGGAATGSPVLLGVAGAAEPFGRVFINAVRMIVIPLVVAIIFSGVAGLGDVRRLGAIGGRTLALYALTLVPGIIIGIAVMSAGLAFVPDIAVPDQDAVSVPELRSITEFLVGLVPPNPFASAASGAILPLIVFTALVAAAASTLEADRRDRMVQAADDIAQALIRLVWWILWLAPIGVFGLIAAATAKMGWGLVQSLGVFILCVGLGLLIYFFAVFVPLLFATRKVGPARFLRSIAGALSIAFSTTSTATAIPVSREEAVNNLGVSDTTTDILIPLGASLYRPGSALFQGAAIVFLAHLYGVELGAASLGGVVLATFLVSLTVAPVPSSGVITMAPALAAVGVPASGLALILGVDRIPDMMRSAVNVAGQIAAAVVVDSKSEDIPKRPPLP